MRTFALLACLTVAVGFAPSRRFAGARTARQSTRAVVEMKRKGKSNMPKSMQGQYDEAMAAQQAIDETKPVFYVFVRRKSAETTGVWYPATLFQGDGNAENLLKGWMGEGMGGMFQSNFKGQLDTGIAKSIYGQYDQFVQQVIGQQPQLKKHTKELEFGYKVKFPGLLEKKPEAEDMTIITDDMKETWLDGIRDSIKDSPLSGILPESMRA